MNWYNPYKNEWREIIETVALEEKRSNIIVEKDLIQSLFLYELSKYDFRLCLREELLYLKHID